MDYPGKRNALLVVDGNNLLAVSNHSHAGLTSPSTGEPTGGIYGFMRKLRSLVLNELIERVSHVVVAYDAGIPEFRRRLVPSYKATRNKKSRDAESEAIYQAYKTQQRTLPPALAPLGIRQLRAPGWEADDVIASVVQDAVPQFKHVIICSSDKDLVQCSLWSPKVRVYSPSSTNRAYRDVPERGYLLRRAIIGDSSDEIEGVAGLGEKRSAEIVSELLTCGFPPLPSKLRNYGGKYAAKFDEDTLERVRRNFVISDLTVTRDRVRPHLVCEYTPLSEKNFTTVCESLGFRSILSELDQFLYVFRGLQ